MNTLRILSLLAAFSCAVTADARADGPLSYHLIDIGVVDGATSSEAYAINASGEVVGLSGPNPFLWTQSGGFTNLISYVGAFATPAGVSDNGQITGSGSSVFLGTPNTGFQSFGSGLARGVNDAGTVVGGLGGSPVYFGSQGGQFLGPLPPGDINGSALAVNNAGTVVGYAASAALHGAQAVYWTNGTVHVIGNLPGGLSLPSAAGAFAQAISGDGAVAGYGTTNVGFNHAFLWTSVGGIQDLGVPAGFTESRGYGINDSNQVVGYGEMLSAQRAILWTTSCGMQDLTSLLDTSGTGWTLEVANAINDAGQIVGYGLTPTGATHAFLLTPVPEPSSFLLLGLGIAFLVVFANRRRVTRGARPIVLSSKWSGR